MKRIKKTGTLFFFPGGHVLRTVWFKNLNKDKCPRVTKALCSFASTGVFPIEHTSCDSETTRVTAGWRTCRRRAASPRVCPTKGRKRSSPRPPSRSFAAHKGQTAGSCVFCTPRHVLRQICPRVGKKKILRNTHASPEGIILSNITCLCITYVKIIDALASNAAFPTWCSSRGRRKQGARANMKTQRNHGAAYGRRRKS